MYNWFRESPYRFTTRAPTDSPRWILWTTYFSCPGIPLLVELMSQLREDPVQSTGALLERWRHRKEHGWLSRLAASESLVVNTEAAAAEFQSAIRRLAAEDSPAQRLTALLDRARDRALDEQEKLELQALLRTKGQSSSPR